METLSKLWLPALLTKKPLVRFHEYFRFFSARSVFKLIPRWHIVSIKEGPDQYLAVITKNNGWTASDFA